jgi:hypothetical protein
MDPWIYHNTFTGQNKNYLQKQYWRCTDSISGQAGRQNMTNAAKNVFFLSTFDSFGHTKL